MKKIIWTLFPLYQYFYHVVSSIHIGLYMFFLKFKLRSLGSFCRIYFADIIEPYNISIGHHVYINKNCTITTTASRVEIGNYVMIGPNVTLIGQDHDMSNWKRPMFFSKKYSRGGIKIEDDVWIGANVTILQGVTVGRGSVIGAGAVVTKDIPPYSVAAGIPAKKIKDRIPQEQIKEALQVDLEKFKNEKVDWSRWGVGSNTAFSGIHPRAQK